MTEVDIDIAVNRFTAFAVCLWLMHDEADPGIFCLCRLDPDSPACRRKRMQGRWLRRQARPCGRSPTLHRSRARHVHAGGARGGNSCGGGGDGDGGGGPDSRCSICGLARCQTPAFCSLSRVLDDLRNADCWGRA